jgi:NADH dehydrogenase [ubiquinone] 1 alpha subcomplex assembly factor 6
VTTTVSQPAIAAMRFQFWRDALAAIFSGKPAPQHPVALAIADVHAARPVQRYYLSQLIEVRAKNLAAPPASATLEQHLATFSPLSGALLQGPLPLVLPPADPETGHMAHTLSHVAHLLTVASLLRALPGLVGKRQLNIPADVAGRHGLVDEEVFRRGAGAPGLRDALFEIATRGMDELITARRDLNKTGGKVVPAECMPLFLAAVPAERYLHRLEKADFDVFAPELAKHDWQLAPRIWWTYQRGKL